MKNTLVACIIVIFLVSGCITITPPANPAAASAVVGTAMVVKLVMPIVIAAGVGLLIVRKAKEPDKCGEPIAPDMVDVCNQLKAAEEVRKMNSH